MRMAFFHPTSFPQLRFRLNRTLRVATALCFLGHGAWGIITKGGWLPFFAVVGIGPETAWKLMPLIGVMDIALAIAVLARPAHPLLIWMMLWALWTALLRPLSGTPGPWEFLERAGNFVPPLLLLLLGKPCDLRIIKRIAICGLGLLLIGHGGFGAFVHKQMLLDHFGSVGIPVTLEWLTLIGYAEILLGIAVMAVPVTPLLWFVLTWKVCTEFLYVTDGGPVNIFEFIERAGDYGLPIAIILISNFEKIRKSEDA